MTDTLPPGRELDAICARVMRLERAPAILGYMTSEPPPILRDGVQYFQELPLLSTTLDGMMMCLEWLRASALHVTMIIDATNGRVKAKLWDGESLRGHDEVVGETLPHAVALSIAEYGRAKQ